MTDGLERTITWVPVGERLPDSGRVVLLALATGDGERWTEPGRMDLTGHWWRMMQGANGLPYAWPVTHWAELPEGPDA